MNFLRSKLATFKQTIKTKQTNQIKKHVFESLKQWDKERVEILKKHLQTIQQILGNLEKRVKNSQDYLLSIQYILKARLKELQIYQENSINNSSFVLVNTQMPGYYEYYDLLKHLIIFEAQNDEKMSIKYNQLKFIFSKLKEFSNISSQGAIDLSPKKSTSLKKNQASEEEEDQNHLDQSSVVMLKTNVRYLIDCELPDIIEQVKKFCELINKVYHSQILSQSAGDIYIHIKKFLSATKLQVQKHRQIGKELLNLNKDFVQRQKKRSLKIKYILSEWVRIDQNANQLLIKQLRKQDNENLIEDYYSLDDLTEADHLPTKDLPIEQYLTRVSVRQFQKFEELVLFRSDAFYNKKIETEVLVTVNKFFHLRKPNHLDAEFTFLLTKQIYVKQLEEFVFRVQKIEKKLLKSPQKQFQFLLQFNIVEDIKKFLEVLQDTQQINLTTL